MDAKFVNLFKEVLEIEDREINATDEFREYEEWDSLAYLSVIAMLDDDYEIVIETDDFKKIRTVGELFNEVEKRMAK